MCIQMADNAAADGKKPLSAGKPAAEAGIGARGRGLTVVGCDVIDSQLNGGDFFSFFIGNFATERFFQSHYQLNGIQRVGAQIVLE